MGIMGNMFNYNKPGPGIDKNAPQKKGFALFWEIFTAKFWSFIPLSLLYLLCSIPVITVGLSDVGITYITRNFTRRKPVILASDFFDAIKKNWKQALIIGIINLVITAMLLFAIVFYFSAWNSGMLYKIGLVISGCLLIVFTFLKYYVNFLVVTFQLTIKQIYKNSLLLSSAGLKQNIIISASLLLVYLFFFGVPTAYAFIFHDALLPIVFVVLTALFLPSIRALIIQFNVFPVIKEKMIDPYYENHPESKNDKMLLNLVDEDEGEEEHVFRDMGKTKESENTDDISKNTIPKQYSKRDIKQIRKRQNDDYDDTI